MKRKQINVEVFDASGTVIFSRPQAHPQDVVAICSLFDCDGFKVVVSFIEVEVRIPVDHEKE